MREKTTNLSSGLEDYIEAIYTASIDNIQLKGAELARKLNISRASVSEALSKLVSKGLIKYNSYEAISLTPAGFEEAKKVYEKHNVLKDFFEVVLNVSSAEASENACQIEHIISQNILDRIIKLTDFCKNNKEFLEEFKQKI